MSTPNVNLDEMPQNSMQPSVPFNADMQLLDALLFLAPLDKDLTAPPTTVAGDAGKTWLVGGAATGAWSGKDGQVALCTGADLWRFFSPKVGWRAFVQDEAADYRYVAGAWSLIP